MAFMSGTDIASRAGIDQNVSGSSVDQLFLKVFSGEILTAFETATVMKELHTVRTISSGKSASFPVTGIADSAYHTAGQSILETTTGSGGSQASSYLSDIAKTEKQIFIDDMLISSTFLANIDELKNHYDIRSIYAAELGKALAKRFDIATMKTLFAASGASANLSGQAAGKRITGADLNTTEEIIDALFSVATTLDENDAPSEGRFAILAPKTYYQLLTSDNNAINHAVSSEYGNGGNVATGSIPMVAGISLVKSNHLKDIAELGDQSSSTAGDGSSAVKNDVTGDSAGSGYESDFSGLVTGSAGSESYGILAGTKEAIGTVKLLDLATESEYQIERQGTLFVAKYMMGHGVLRPECSVAVTVD